MAEEFTRLTPAPEATIDKSKFDTRITLTALRVPKARCHALMKHLKGFVLDMPRQRSVVNDPTDEANSRLLLLKEEVKDASFPSISPDFRAELALDDLPLTTHELRLGYDYYNAEHVLRALLPDGVEVPGSFETVGHIAHLNLRDDVMQYKDVIGRVLLDKNPRLRTIVNKVGAIESEFRVPTWELLAGSPSLVTEVKQHGVPFKLDFGEVYWNSRLEAEHKRMVESIRPGEILCDAMAGVGPFAVPAGRAGIRTYANDLNPKCYEYMKINARAAKVKGRVKCYNMCARAFIRALLKYGPGPPPEEDARKPADDGKKEKEKKPVARWAATGDDDDDGDPPAGAVFDHVTMNLPASAIEFLDVFKGAFDRRVWGERNLPRVHVYTFKRADETHADVVKRGEGYLGGPIKDASVHEVRDVAPNKIMLCLSFTLTEDVAFAADDESPDSKRAKVA
jgi:tRNA (guanine37-N1)-methyltransferase